MASPLFSTAIHALRRSGVFISRAQRSIWFHGAKVADFEEAAELIRDVRTAHPANRLLLTSRDADVCRWLRARYPGYAVLPLPWNGAEIFVGRFFRELDPKISIWLGLDGPVSLGLLDKIRNRGIPIVVVGTPPSALSERSRHIVERVDGFIGRSPPSFEQLASFLARLSPDPPKVHARRRTRAAADSKLGGWLAATRSGRRISDWDALVRRLGSPRTILCLGNGPTSEDPAVVETPHDCLLRVNHRWRERGILTRPDVVFVGNLRTTLRVPPPCVFAFRDVAKEREILLRHLFFGRRRDSIEHFTLQRMPSPLDDRAWPATPTNGAVMVAAAVMLRPERLIIAGIDLYQDARGLYPGQTVAENEYLRGHARSVEIEVIAHALSRFHGELVVLSPNLERGLRERSSRPSPSIAIRDGDS